MSRVHDALRRAEQMLDTPLGDAAADQAGLVRSDGLVDGAQNPYDGSLALSGENGLETPPGDLDLRGIDQLAADGAQLGSGVRSGNCRSTGVRFFRAAPPFHSNRPRKRI